MRPSRRYERRRAGPMLMVEKGLPEGSGSIWRCAQARFRRGFNIYNRRYEAGRDGWVGAPLPNYRFCAAHRDRDGLLSAPVHEEVIMAKGPADAATQVKAIELDMTNLKVNALYLVDANGHVVWSLRIADFPDDHS